MSELSTDQILQIAADHDFDIDTLGTVLEEFARAILASAGQAEPIYEVMRGDARDNIWAVVSLGVWEKTPNYRRRIVAIAAPTPAAAQDEPEWCERCGYPCKCKAQHERGAFDLLLNEFAATQREIAVKGEACPMRVIKHSNKLRAQIMARASASPVSGAARDVLAERQRQISDEGWTAEHDDGTNDVAALADAAVCYAMHAAQTLAGAYSAPNTTPNKTWWPWDASWWKPTTPRRDLVKAGALILAEIERIDRAEIERGERAGGES